MGRLFWKFFVSLWLAQVLTVALVGATLWLMQPGTGTPFDMARPPPKHGPMHGPMHALPHRGPPPPPRAQPAVPLLPILVGALVSLLFAALLAAYFARPIRTLRTAFSAVAEGDLNARIGPNMGRHQDELSDLGQCFDHMAERLQSLMESQQRLLHDVSHEMRSPLARLQAALDLMQQQPKRSAELSERIQRDIMRMDSLVGELLTLARLDTGISSHLNEQVDLCEVICDIVDDASLEAEEKHCAVRVELTPPLALLGNHELLHRAIENVLRNALRHTPENSTILINSRCTAGHILLTIADNGPGVAEAELTAIFDSFVRGDSAQHAKGFGLGLAITRSIVTAHGGKVFAANQPGGGLQVTFELPTSPAHLS